MMKQFKKHLSKHGHKYALGMLGSVILVLVIWGIALFNTQTRAGSGNGPRMLVLPSQVSLTTPVVYLGSARDKKSGKQVQGYLIVHYRSEAKAGGVLKGGEKCYGFLAPGAKWKTFEPWIFNTANVRNLDANTLFYLQEKNVYKREDAADGALGNGISKNIFDAGSLTSESLSADLLAPDNKNEVYFANVSSPGAIAVTIVWGIFSGPPPYRELVERDQVYDDQDFDWSTAGQAGKMDFENISTHELGHSFGLNDMYSSICTEVTMYGYSSLGEIKKQTLESSDITGISTLYR